MRTDQAYTGSEELVLAVSLELAAVKWKGRAARRRAREAGRAYGRAAAGRIRFCRANAMK
ncbi:hypothetical protein PAMC26577_10645 [Caballeronia sordidicola]|uniref:Uncharacterized protein n=1 Tax=Caballeronia sordidicola TaxID=196367 RepID=A0A242MYK6_CABSO|nr:hypothetical protein PAMC26577_10645 [Caballeronia sordidicola]